jgi:hypothetical protein
VPDVARRRSVGDIENEIDEVDNALKIARKEVDDWTPTRERVDAGEGVLGKRFVELHPDDKSDIARLEAVRDDLQARRKNLTDELNDAFEQATPVTPARAADDVPPRLPEQVVQPQVADDAALRGGATPPEPPSARPIATTGGAPRQPRVPDTGRRLVRTYSIFARYRFANSVL